MMKITIYCDFHCFFKLTILIFERKSHYIVNVREIGETIKSRRQSLGINQFELSELAGIGINTLVAIERGQGNPRIETLMAVADTLGLQVEIILKQ